MKYCLLYSSNCWTGFTSSENHHLPFSMPVVYWPHPLYWPASILLLRSISKHWRVGYVLLEYYLVSHVRVHLNPYSHVISCNLLSAIMKKVIIMCMKTIVTNHAAFCLHIPQKHSLSRYPALAPRIPTFWVACYCFVRPIMLQDKHAHAHCDAPCRTRTFCRYNTQ